MGDYLFVSKASYGPRVPQTPLHMPLTQHTLPIVNSKSYLEWPAWDYKRVKGLGDVQLNDIVVFNFPAGDTVAVLGGIEIMPEKAFFKATVYTRKSRDKVTHGFFQQIRVYITCIKIGGNTERSAPRF